MEPIASDGRRTVLLRVMAPGEAPESSSDGAPFPALVWAAVPTSAEQKHRLCAVLLADECRYVVCGGMEAAAWEDAADEAFAAQDLSDAESEARHVMTTSHPGESPAEVVFFLIWTTIFDEHDFTRYVVLLVGEDDRVREELVAGIRAALRSAN